MEFNIAVLGGDGIGPEVTGQGVRVLEAVGRVFGHRFNLTYGDIGGISIDKENFDLTDLPSGPIAFFDEFFDNRAFHGAGQRLQLRANPGARFSNFLIRFTEPGLTGPVRQPVSLDVDLYLRTSLLRLYDEDRTGGSVIFGKAWTRNFST